MKLKHKFYIMCRPEFTKPLRLKISMSVLALYLISIIAILIHKTALTISSCTIATMIEVVYFSLMTMWDCIDFEIEHPVKDEEFELANRYYPDRRYS